MKPLPDAADPDTPLLEGEVESALGMASQDAVEPAPEAERPPEAASSGAVDSHCHLFLIQGDARDVAKEARAAGVDRLVCVGIDAETSGRSLELAESLRGVFSTAGVHPHSASGFEFRISRATGRALVAGRLARACRAIAERRRINIAFDNEVGGGATPISIRGKCLSGRNGAPVDQHETRRTKRAILSPHGSRRTR